VCFSVAGTVDLVGHDVRDQGFSHLARDVQDRGGWG
jgi:hypothetical protein